MPNRLRPFFRGWDAKREILRPLIVNVLSAGVLFLAAMGLKDHIHKLFTSPPEQKDWPLVCILEPHVVETGPVTADLFIINIDRDNSYDQSRLADMARERSGSDREAISPLIELSMSSSASEDSIADIRPDDAFNKGKGRASAKRLDPGGRRWVITVEEIKPSLILKLTVATTTTDRSIDSRANLSSLPVRLTYARSPLP